MTEGSGRIAIVTGSESGIGRATAVALAEQGYDVGITWFRDEAGGRATADEVRGTGRRAELRPLDLTRLPDAADVVDELADALGGLDAIVNNAAAGLDSPFLETDFETFERTVRLTLFNPFLCGQRAAKRMVAQGRGGSIVNISSVHEHVPLQESAGYTAGKHGVGGLTKVMALELAPHGIRVNTVAPGEIATKMTGNEDTDPDTEERRGVPLGRPGDANEIGAAAAFLASEEASYITGETLVVDGGMNLMAAMANQLAQ